MIRNVSAAAAAARVVVGWLAALVLCSLALWLSPSVAWAQGSDTGAFAEQASRGLGFALFGSFVAGLGSSLTPCVWPMIPITVSIFGATESSSRARGAALSATFVLGIACLFVPLGMAAAFGGMLMGAMLAKPAVVIGIALLFAALASSMFGAFEMDLPPALKNRLSTVGGVGFKGAFVLGLAMGLVATPCTGPFVTGLVTWIATTENVLLGGASMFTFALGLGVPFFIAGSFAVNLPKGGAWMMGIKWASGVLLSYFALKYLRDRWPAIFRDELPSPGVTLALGIATALIGFALGVVHILAERRKSPIAKWSKSAKLASILPAIAGVYLLLTWPELEAAAALHQAAQVEGAPAPIAWQKDEAAARAQALAERKPVVIDFGATWCTACKEIEHKTWPVESVRREAAQYVAIMVDATDDEDPKIVELKEKYKVVGLPTVVLFDAAGNERARFTEFVGPEAMTAALQAARSSERSER